MRDDTPTLPLVEEELIVDRKTVADGRVIVSTRTEVLDKALSVELEAEEVDVERVPLGIEIDVAPDVRVEGDVTIVPVVEERLVVERRLVLVEEIRIRRNKTFQTERVETRLRRQQATVERISEGIKPRRQIMANLYNENAPTFASGSSYNTLSAFFDDRSDAESAVSRLKDAGIAESDIRFMPGYEGGSDTAAVASDDRVGFWAKLEDWLFPDEDRATYAEGLRRGGFLVSVSNLNDALYETAHDILDDEGSIDIDERADTWRQEGWSATSSNEALASSTYDASRQQRKFDDDLDGVAQASASREDAFDAGSRDDTIPVVEENLRVGKRDVNNGSVRVRAYTVEQPVRQDVSLRDESVTIDRRTVDRPLTDADRAFQDRTISAEEHHEEAVVSKDARVVEEIGIRKTASERTETVADTVRKTEVEIDDERRDGQSQQQNSFGQTQGQGFRRD